TRISSGRRAVWATANAPRRLGSSGVSIQGAVTSKGRPAAAQDAVLAREGAVPGNLILGMGVASSLLEKISPLTVFSLDASLQRSYHNLFQLMCQSLPHPQL